MAFSVASLPCSRFHQHFTSSFFANLLSTKKSKMKCNFRNASKILSYGKAAVKMLVKLTPIFNVQDINPNTLKKL